MAACSVLHSHQRMDQWVTSGLAVRAAATEAAIAVKDNWRKSMGQQTTAAAGKPLLSDTTTAALEALCSTPHMGHEADGKENIGGFGRWVSLHADARSTPGRKSLLRSRQAAAVVDEARKEGTDNCRSSAGCSPGDDFVERVQGPSGAAEEGRFLSNAIGNLQVSLLTKPSRGWCPIHPGIPTQIGSNHCYRAYKAAHCAKIIILLDLA